MRQIMVHRWLTFFLQAILSVEVIFAAYNQQWSVPNCSLPIRRQGFSCRVRLLQILHGFFRFPWLDTAPYQPGS